MWVRGVDQVTVRSRAARIAAHSVSATTPTKLPSRTIVTTPGMSAMELSSTLAGPAIAVCGRTARPCNMPGTRMSQA